MMLGFGIGLGLLLLCGLLCANMYDKDGPGCWVGIAVLVVGVVVGSWLMWPVFESMPYYGFWPSLLIFIVGVASSLYVSVRLGEAVHSGRLYRFSPDKFQFYWGYITPLILALYAGHVISNIWPGNLQQVVGVVLGAFAGYVMHIFIAMASDPTFLTDDY